MIEWDLFVTYIRDVKHLNVSGNNYNTYAMLYRRIASYMEGAPFNRLTCDRYLASLSQLSNASKNNHLKIIKNICGALRYYELERDDVLSKIEKIPYFEKKRLKRIEVLTQKELIKMAEVRIPYKKMRIELNRKWRAVIYTLCLGLRVQELCNLKWDDYKGDYLIIREGKTPSAYRTVPVPVRLQRLYSQLTRYVHGYMFGSAHGRLNPAHVRHDMKLRALTVGITQKSIYPHVVRHSMITHWIQSGMPLAWISEVVGHKSYDVTKQYAHLSMKETRQVIESGAMYRSNTQERLKELLKSEIERVYDKDKLQALYTLLEA